MNYLFKCVRYNRLLISEVCNSYKGNTEMKGSKNSRNNISYNYPEQRK